MIEEALEGMRGATLEGWINHTARHTEAIEEDEGLSRPLRNLKRMKLIIELIYSQNYQ